MRARYTAYVNEDIDFLIKGSLHPDSPGEADRRTTEAWAKAAEWHGLEILSNEFGGPDDKIGKVEFVAKFSLQGEPQRHHEIAEFRRNKDGWGYYDGEEIHPQPFRGPRIKVSRNDACPCESGKKFKKCCGPVLSSGAQNPEQLVRGRFTAIRTGEATFLSRSLHPDAKEPTDEQAEVELKALNIGKVAEKGEEASVSLSYEQVTDGKSEKISESQSLKKLGGKWLFVDSKTA
jgi:SEC-C motif-containing protein